MSARKQLDCLLENGFITTSQYNAMARIVGLTGDLDLSYQLTKDGSPFFMEEITAIDDSTPKSPNPAPPSATRAVITAHENDVNMSLIEGQDPTSTFGHSLKQGTNYTLTLKELEKVSFIAVDNSANAKITITYYK